MSDLLQVAKLAGVSRATAARAFSSPDLVREETRNKIFAASEQLGFRPNHIARQLRTQSTRMIGVLLPSLQNPIFAAQLQAMENLAQLHGYSLLVATSNYQPLREAAIVENMLRQRVDGLVLTVADADHSAVLLDLQREAIPLVLVHNSPQRLGLPAVRVDNRLAVMQATGVLLKLGHRHIGMIAGPMLQSDRARQRYQGYCDAMSKAGLTPADVVEMPDHIHSDLNTLLPLLHGPRAFTALLCTNDLLALSVMGELMRTGYQIPRQISVIGFDGIEMGRMQFPSLSSVVQPLEEMGRLAIAHLLAQIAGETPPPGCLAHQFRYGESIAPPATQTL
ncbi:LacI family DNA-binding transcriptional regulator [Erwiniaceae bacterium BAC15a-03b]|uniref:LacI family DNA-binding transcriptional regulator n=1 Tax=Winslowiella arboricola TaxID=2978220 RepID=A0A9J6PLK8_9GAMM|nr:LacI family DNA-binding transcriptional regulator [Winslowiella arboricola]MCU5771779.1 LacI family DNA-binding transcriptional regulator [Winslowiella arboricola]MCU5776629.1 LacI family DNA-binding transcriptional regulator [Winslowiella arboricola]